MKKSSKRTTKSPAESAIDDRAGAAEPSPPIRTFNRNGVAVLSDAQEAAERIALRGDVNAPAEPFSASLGEIVCLALGKSEAPELFGAFALDGIADRLDVLWMAAGNEDLVMDREEILRHVFEIMRTARGAAHLAMRLRHARQGAAEGGA